MTDAPAAGPPCPVCGAPAEAAPRFVVNGHAIHRCPACTAGFVHPLPAPEAAAALYDEDGAMQNAGFLDYRMPVASDLPMLDTVIVEVANPLHPYGVRGVGEVPIVPPLAAVANAMRGATGVRFTDLPLSPPRVLEGVTEG